MCRSIVAICLLLMFLGGTAPTVSAEENVVIESMNFRGTFKGTKFNQKISARKKKERLQIIDESSQLIVTGKSSASTFLKRGNAYLKLDKLSKALYDLNEVLLLESNNAKALHLRGVCYRKQKQYKKSIQDCTQAIKINPHNWEYYAERGDSLFESKRYDLAIADFKKTLELAPDDKKIVSNIYSRIAKCWGGKRDAKKLFSFFTKALEIDNNNSTIYYQRARCFVNAKMFAKAVKDIDSALEIGDRNGIAYFLRVEIYTQTNQLKKAIEEIDKLLKTWDNKYPYHLLKAALLTKDKDFKKAESEYDKAMKFKPYLAITYYYRGQYWRQRKQYPKAIKDIEAAIRVNDKYQLNAYNELAFLLATCPDK